MNIKLNILRKLEILDNSSSRKNIYKYMYVCKEQIAYIKIKHSQEIWEATAYQ